MKAWLLDGLGGLDKLRLADTPDPVAAPGEVVLRVLIAGLNPADRYLSEGLYPARPAFPHILGRDGLGIVESVASDVSEFKPGDKVAIVRSEIGITRHGTFAQKVAVPAESLVKTQPSWSDEENAGATLVYLTSYQALTMWAHMPASGLVLVTGASGGVGIAAVHLGLAMGHTVIGMSRDPAKSERLLKIGCAAVYDPNDTQWRKKIKEQFAPRRVDLAIDNIGGTLFTDVIDILGHRGRISCVGRLAGPTPNFNTATLFFRRIRIGGVQVGDQTAIESRQNWSTCVELLNRKGFRPLVDSVFDMPDLLEAFDKLQKGPMGKVLLRTT